MAPGPEAGTPTAITARLGLQGPLPPAETAVEAVSVPAPFSVRQQPARRALRLEPAATVFPPPAV